VRGKQNVHKRLLLQAAAGNLALLLRKMMGVGTPRALHDVVARLLFILVRLLSTINAIPVPPRSLLACRSLGYRIAVDVFDGKLEARNRRFRHGLLGGRSRRGVPLTSRGSGERGAWAIYECCSEQR
jgi:hypothetical protein